MFRSTGSFDRLLDKATSQLLLEPDWDAILQISDLIRQNDVQGKYAVSAIKKKCFAQNPNVALFALQVLESCVKNCGASVHHEVACKSFMDELRSLIKSTTNEKVKNKVLEIIQTWAYAFRSEPNYRAVQDVLNLMKMEGYTFPSVKYETDAMFTADCAPEWADGECCHRCRVQFSVVQRKHHCRNCGQVFCSKCSNHNSSIPKFGIEKEVRVCSTCFEKLQKSMKGDSEHSSSDLPAVYTKSTLATQSQAPPSSGKSEQELQEEEELQLALALSQSEAENKEKEKIRSTHSLLSGTQNSVPHVYEFSPVLNESQEVNNSDSELNKYLNRPYWEQKQQQIGSGEQINSSAPTMPTPSAPVSVSTSNVIPTSKETEKFQNGETDSMDEFVSTLKSSIEIFINRMKSKSSRGLSIANDSSIQTLFMNLTAMHSQLLRYIQEQDESRAYYEKLQDKLSQIKDAREALDALREDHEEKLRQQAEEAERQRQIMMAQKLEIMRKKKQEYLQYQRQIAMQRMQEQEREMFMRQEHQMYQPAPPQQPTMMPPGVYAPSQQPIPNQAFSPDPSSDNSPVHGGYYQNASAGPAAMPANQQQPAGPFKANNFNVQGMNNHNQASGFNNQPPPAPPQPSNEVGMNHQNPVPMVQPAAVTPQQPAITVVPGPAAPHDQGQNHVAAAEPLISFD